MTIVLGILPTTLSGQSPFALIRDRLPFIADIAVIDSGKIFVIEYDSYGPSTLRYLGSDGADLGAIMLSSESEREVFEKNDGWFVYRDNGIFNRGIQSYDSLFNPQWDYPLSSGYRMLSWETDSLNNLYLLSVHDGGLLRVQRINATGSLDWDVSFLHDTATYARSSNIAYISEDTMAVFITELGYVNKHEQFVRFSRDGSFFETQKTSGLSVSRIPYLLYKSNDDSIRLINSELVASLYEQDIFIQSFDSDGTIGSRRKHKLSLGERPSTVTQLKNGNIVAGIQFSYASYGAYLMLLNEFGDSLSTKVLNLPGWTVAMFNSFAPLDSGLLVHSEIYPAGNDSDFSHLIYTLTPNLEWGIKPLTGVVYGDLDGDGIYSAGDVSAPFKQINRVPSSFFASTDATGSYAGFLLGNSTLNFELPTSAAWSFASPLEIMADTLSGSSNIVNFRLEPASAFQDLSVAVSASLVRPDQTSFCYINIQNTGNATVTSPQIAMAFDSRFTLDSASIPFSSISADSAVFTLPDVLPLQYFQIKCYLHMLPDPTIVGDTTWIHAHLITSDDSLENNMALFKDVIIGSYDPNDKVVFPMGIEEAGYISTATNSLTYTIRFQNTGTDTAFNVYITDEFPAEVDLDRIQFKSSTHNFYVLAGGELQRTFVFENILLPDSGTNFEGSNGMIQFELPLIKPISFGTEISNVAGIVFDINEPVITNEASVTWGIPGVDEPSGQAQIDQPKRKWIVAQAPGIIWLGYSEAQLFEVYSITGELLGSYPKEGARTPVLTSQYGFSTLIIVAIDARGNVLDTRKVNNW